MKTTWVTFYSYKGGVGRSMALANVAAAFARNGRRVVMIDFDLEAPGLDSFKELGNTNRKGVVDYIEFFLKHGKSPTIESYVHECPAHSQLRGKLWLMPSGEKSTGYIKRLQALNWAQLYDDGIAEPLVDGWKSSIEKAYEPDYVFVDSRTGLTDIGGVCTLHFPDIVVLLFSLNRQNISGTESVLRTIVRQQSRPPIQTITVASPVPNLDRASSPLLAKRIKNAEKRLHGKLTATIDYFAAAALEERIWTLDTIRAPIQTDYHILGHAITRKVKDGIDFLISRVEQVEKSFNASAASALIRELRAEYSDRGDAHRAIAKLERTRGNIAASIQALTTSLEIEPTEEAYDTVAAYFRKNANRAQLQTVTESVYNKILPHVSEENIDICSSLLLQFMYLGEYAAAMEVGHAIRRADRARYSDLAFRFNLAEARRRNEQKIVKEDWKGVLKLAGDENESLDAVTLANRLQALHIAYASIGDLEAAKSQLEQAHAIVSRLNRTAEVFSVATYDEVGVGEFIKTNTRMRKALDAGCLWDGMKLERIKNNATAAK